MKPHTDVLPAGLYMVATPIGNARDITLRALDVLASADVLAAEDTRSLRRLLQIHNIPIGDRPLVAYHDHNGARARPRLLHALQSGQSVAYASDAGTPMIADPGFDLVRSAIVEGYNVTTAPGATALAAAVTVAGLPSDRLFFAGFLPNTSTARRTALTELRQIPATLVLYESPKRVAATLADAADVLGDRPAAICRELTKKFEECLRGGLKSLAERCADSPPRGEIVLLIERGEIEAVNELEMESALRNALTSHTVKDAATIVSNAFGLPRRQVYQIAMRMNNDD
jgi:16S rRNA (cytidine1402-2'-O)-methyltransferase